MSSYEKILFNDDDLEIILKGSKFNSFIVYFSPFVYVLIILLLWIAGIFLYFPYYGIGSDFGFIYFMAIIAACIISPLFFDNLIGLLKRKIKKEAPVQVYLEIRANNVPKKNHFEFSINKRKILIPTKDENLVKINEFSNSSPIKEKNYLKYSLRDPSSIILPIKEDLHFGIYSKKVFLSFFKQGDPNYFYVEPESLTLRIKADFFP